ncbi:Predicted polyphosphate- or ATP-dependent NAD kinase [Anaerovirgula multivorans]|uniref:Predicted polyphosphate- or ATP-dependent NAD kinase n=1 Tax=Anaerovirgula multivorans TaxID=312168 RepID=A0A239CDH7_9FIRM|nr:NAD(+)/NADH kinase [Anaerovirgula multivorans]SNS18257.1 Predicted polyphosphate- or ATP-dependent NAD kinase [Anaerovirgula multivorans]
MSSIGIIANPASGKDIRRLVSHATVIDNHEKVNIVKRIILGAQQCGVKNIYIMPDTFNIGYKAIDSLCYSKELTSEIEVLAMQLSANLQDTINAAKMMEEMKIGCMIVLGGDGTNRAAAKAIKNTPLISISTGTNNVYPEMVEGTVAGMAAAVVASGKHSKDRIGRKDKKIEIYKNKELTDIALIDAVISKNLFVGSKAIWNMEDIIKIIVSKAHPASIGFSSIVGCKTIIKEDDDFGASVDLTEDRYAIIAPIAAGLIKEVYMDEPTILNLNEAYVYEAKSNGMIAVDGEREIPFQKNEKIIFKITRGGPFRVNIKKALEDAQKNGFFNR